jgi:hypothetical protein
MRISEIVRGRRRITAETAIAFAKVFEIEPQFWLNLQRDYDLAIEVNKTGGPAALKYHVEVSEVLSAIRAMPKTAKARSMAAVAHKRKAARASGRHARKGPSTFPESWAKPAGQKRAGKRSKK